MWSLLTCGVGRDRCLQAQDCERCCSKFGDNKDIVPQKKATDAMPGLTELPSLIKPEPKPSGPRTEHVPWWQCPSANDSYKWCHDSCAGQGEINGIPMQPHPVLSTGAPGAVHDAHAEVNVLDAKMQAMDRLHSQDHGGYMTLAPQSQQYKTDAQLVLLPSTVEHSIEESEAQKAEQRRQMHEVEQKQRELQEAREMEDEEVHRKFLDQQRFEQETWEQECREAEEREQQRMEQIRLETERREQELRSQQAQRRQQERLEAERKAEEEARRETKRSNEASQQLKAKKPEEEKRIPSPKSKGSGKAASKQAAGPKAAARANAKPQETFNIVLDKKEGQGLGINVATLEDGSLKIEGISDDPSTLLGAWNKRNPAQLVKPGDLIFEANGHSGDCNAIIRQLKATQTLAVCIHRP